MSITPCEKAGVGQSSSVSERTERPVVERTGRPVVEGCQELNTERAQIRTLLDRQREQIHADCQAEIRSTKSKLIMTEEVHKN